jgi:hypothetical protein
LGPVATALGAQLRRLGLGLRMSVVNHDVVCSRNVVAKMEQPPTNAVRRRQS